jgi:hypothetical protein
LSWFLPDPVFQPVMALHMAALVTAMIDDVIAAFDKETLDRLKFSVRNNTVNTLRHSTFQEMLTFLMNNPTTITRSTLYHGCPVSSNDPGIMPVRWWRMTII